MLMNSETDQKDSCSETITGHVQKGIGECAVSSWYKVLNSFVHEWWNDSEENPVQGSIMKKCFFMNGKRGQKTKQCVLKKVGKLANKMVKDIKGNGNPDPGKTLQNESGNGSGFG